MLCPDAFLTTSTQASVLNFEGGAVEWGCQEYNRDNFESQDAISQLEVQMQRQEATNAEAVGMSEAGCSSHAEISIVDHSKCWISTLHSRLILCTQLVSEPSSSIPSLFLISNFFFPFLAPYWLISRSAVSLADIVCQSGMVHLRGLQGQLRIPESLGIRIQLQAH